MFVIFHEPDEFLNTRNNVKKVLTLCVIKKDSRLLLGMKKRGFGAGVWNGFGGKVEAGETIEQAAMREVQEEVGIVPSGLKPVGVITFTFESDPKIMEVHIFSVTDFTGEPIETEEMRPKWFALNDIPYDTMWPDDRFWLPMFLAGKSFTGEFHFDRPSDPDYTAKILRQELRVVGSKELEKLNM